MLTLRHKDADLIRFDWLPDRGGRQEVRIERVFPNARRLLPLEMRDAPTDEALGRWLRGRTIPANRAYVRSFLAKQGLNERDTRGILAVSRGLSLQDVHWIAEDGFPGRWADVNLYENPFSRVLAWLAFTGYGSYVRTSVRSSPEYTTNGALPKCWRRIGGEIVLFKGGSEGAANTGREPQSEFHAAQVAATRRPVLYPDFDEAAAARLTPALRARLRSLAASFCFARHPRLDLSAPRLRALESFVRATAARLSESRPT